MQKNIYCFSGLGADEKLFSNLRVPHYRLKYINWLKPVAKETLPQYARRLSQQVDEREPVLLGVSFGGMLAIEAAKYVQASQTIIISSIQSAAHFPFYYHWANKLQVIKFIPNQLLVTPSPVADFLFGAETTADKKLLRHFAHTANPAFIKWALQAIINWKNDTLPQNLAHLHGTKDCIIPLPKNVHHVIKGGGHLMVYNRADSVNKLLQLLLPGQP